MRQAQQRRSGYGRSWGFRTEVSKDNSTGDEIDGPAAVGNVSFNPVGGGGLAAWATDRPDVFQRVGEAAEDAQDGGRVGMANPALVLPISYIQGMMSAVLHAPTLLFQAQPLSLVELAGSA